MFKTIMGNTVTTPYNMKNLATKKYVNDAIDDAIANLEVPSGSSGVDIVIDDALSDTSTNPVQNKVVNAAIQELEENKADVSHTHDFGAKIEGTKYIEDINWEYGVVNKSDGKPGAKVTRARTADYLEYDESVVITMSGYAQIIAFFYNDEKGYIGHSGDDSWLTGTINLKDYAPEGAAYFKLSGRSFPEGSSDGEVLTNDITPVSNNVELQRDFVQTLTERILDDVNERLDEELASKIDESRVTKEPEDIDETWSVNISGEADKALKDELGNDIADTYISDVQRLDEKDVFFATTKDSFKHKLPMASPKYVDDTLNIINGEEVKEGLVEEELGWTEGVIQTANGNDGDNNTRARTIGYIKYDDSVVLNVSNNAQVYVLFYTSKSTSGYISAVGWKTGTINVKDYAPEGAKYFRLNGRYVTTSAPNGIALTGKISYVSNNVKLERYCERTVVATLKDLDSRINKVNNLFYKGINFSEITEGDVVLDSNYVTCLYGDTEFETLNISFNTGIDANVPNLSQESVLILDLTDYSTTPTIVFNEDIKWLNGEVPEITHGKVYMISFVVVRTYDDLFSYCLAVGGEFA